MPLEQRAASQHCPQKQARCPWAGHCSCSPFLALGDRKSILSCPLTFSPKGRVGFLTPEICGCTLVVQFTLDIEGVVLLRIHTGNLELHAVYVVFLESKTNVQFLPRLEWKGAQL